MQVARFGMLWKAPEIADFFGITGKCGDFPLWLAKLFNPSALRSVCLKLGAIFTMNCAHCEFAASAVPHIFHRIRRLRAACGRDIWT